MTDILEVNCATGEETLRPMTPEEEAQLLLDQQAAAEEALKDLARQRIQRLRETEWTQLRDTPLTNPQRNLWATYRQALRDMILGDDDWPEPPTGSET